MHDLKGLLRAPKHKLDTNLIKYNISPPHTTIKGGFDECTRGKKVGRKVIIFNLFLWSKFPQGEIPFTVYCPALDIHHQDYFLAL